MFWVCFTFCSETCASWLVCQLGWVSLSYLFPPPYNLIGIFPFTGDIYHYLFRGCLSSRRCEVVMSSVGLILRPQAVSSVFHWEPATNYLSNGHFPKVNTSLMVHTFSAFSSHCGQLWTNHNFFSCLLQCSAHMFTLTWVSLGLFYYENVCASVSCFDSYMVCSSV